MTISRTYGGIMAVVFASTFLLAFSPFAHAATLVVGGPQVPEHDVVSTTTIYGQSIAIFNLTFSLEAFGSDVYMPASIMRGIETSTSSISYNFETRKTTLTKGFGAALLYTHDAKKHGDTYLIPQGERRTFTVIAAFDDAVKGDLEQRLRITHLPLLLGDEKRAINLNPSEIEDFKTDFLWLEE